MRKGILNLIGIYSEQLIINEIACDQYDELREQFDESHKFGMLNTTLGVFKN